MINLLTISLFTTLWTTAPGLNHDDPKATPKSPPSVESTFQYPKSIAWIGTWQAAKAEAERTGKPILLLSAAPQCRGIPGVW